MGNLKFRKEEKQETKSIQPLRSWKILIVDDEIEVHSITQSVLKNFDFDGDAIELLSAYSGEEAIAIMREHTDIALMLLDVVMETDDAGLKVAETVRGEMGNSMVRIVLRTGQPGSAPETEVIKNYDINDYKEKTELTSQKLYTTILSALRSYRDLKTIHDNRIGLNKIIHASRDLLSLRSMKLFSEGVLTQIMSMLKVNPDSVMVQAEGAFTVQCTGTGGDYELIAATGSFSQQNLDLFLTDEIVKLLSAAIESKENQHGDHAFVGYVETSKGMKNLIYLSDYDRVDETGKQLLDIFMANTSVMYENLTLNNEIIDTQKELIGMLGEVVENRSQDTAHHVNRVAQVSYILALAYGLDEDEAQTIRLASPMHDIGKVSTPDSILLKPGKLTEEEFEIMKNHARVGYEILNPSVREILQTSAIIAHEHHEKWDGSGYPRGLAGEGIHIYGRITALADVFDALSQKRTYKESWPLDIILEHIKQERGSHFDPKIVDLFFENLDSILKVSKSDAQ
ncbi:MAG: DUF3369 domain-containing protein [Reichenbachiella sp.]